MNDEMNRTCYVYKWTHIPTLMWYVGSRTGKNSNLNDGYICSSKTVKRLILEHPSEWKRTIIATGTKEEMYELESEILQLFDARKDERSFNRHNNHKGICIGGWNKGLSGLQVAWNKGKTLSKEHKANIAKAKLGSVPGNKGKKITDPAIRLKYKQGAIRRHQKNKAK